MFPVDDSRTAAFLRGIGVGAAGAFAMLLLVFAMSASVNEQWLNKWQTLVAGVMALGGAGVTVAVMFWQTAEQRRLAQTRRQFSHAAARARLRPALSDLSNWLSDNVAAILADGAPPSRPDKDALHVMDRLIETGPAESLPGIHEIIAQYQIVDARLREYYASKPKRQFQACDRVIDLAELECRLSDAYGYADRRMDNVRIEVDKERIARSLRFMMVEVGIPPDWDVWLEKRGVCCWKPRSSLTIEQFLQLRGNETD